MSKTIAYVEALIPAGPRELAVACGICTKDGVSNTHLWLSADTGWSLLGHKHFGLPFMRVSQARRIGKVVAQTEPGAPIVLLDEDYALVRTSITEPAYPDMMVTPPPLVLQACFEILEAILNAKEG